MNCWTVNSVLISMSVRDEHGIGSLLFTSCEVSASFSVCSPPSVVSKMFAIFVCNHFFGSTSLIFFRLGRAVIWRSSNASIKSMFSLSLLVSFVFNTALQNAEVSWGPIASNSAVFRPIGVGSAAEKCWMFFLLFPLAPHSWLSM